MFSEIDLISSYHYIIIDDLNSINIKHLEMFPVGTDSTKYINSMDTTD